MRSGWCVRGVVANMTPASGVTPALTAQREQWTKLKTMGMEVKDIIKAALQLSKKDKTLLVNEVLVSMSSKCGRTMPVYRGLEVFGETYRRFKGTDYSIGKADFRWMKELLVCIHDKLAAGVEDISTVGDDDIILNLNAFLTAVKQMQNAWYYNNRFTPEGLAKDFHKIYSNISTRNTYERTKTAFDYL